MKKTFYIVSFILLLVAFLGCDKEPVDEVVKDDYLKGEAIVRFDLNGVTYGARHNDVSTNYNENGSLSIVVNAKDEDNDFNRIILSMAITSTEKGVYPTTNFANSDSTYSFIGMKYIDEPWEYFSFAYENDLEVDRGALTITEVNEYAGQIEGNFSFILFPPPEEELDLPDDVPYPDPQKIENGYFKYINYKD